VDCHLHGVSIESVLVPAHMKVGRFFGLDCTLNVEVQVYKSDEVVGLIGTWAKRSADRSEGSLGTCLHFDPDLQRGL
jgi:hypothetical protein